MAGLGLGYFFSLEKNVSYVISFPSSPGVRVATNLCFYDALSGLLQIVLDTEVLDSSCIRAGIALCV